MLFVFVDIMKHTFMRLPTFIFFAKPMNNSGLFILFYLFCSVLLILHRAIPVTSDAGYARVCLAGVRLYSFFAQEFF